MRDALVPQWQALKLDSDETGKSVYQKLYRGMIGSLFYLTTCRLDILFGVCICARFYSNPKESHLSAVKCIFRHLNGTTDIWLWYPKGFSVDLIGYTNADFVGCKVDRKNTLRTCQLLGNALIS